VWIWAGRVARECMGVTLNNETTVNGYNGERESDNIKIVFDEAIVNIWLP